MKSYTDVNQSKTLAEILPLESADMWWAERYAGQVLENGKHVVEEKPVYYLSLSKPSDNNCSQDIIKDIPCWSLASLLDVLHITIKRKNKRMFLTLEKAGAYNLYYKSPDRLDELWETKEEPIDACYEMILKLHELNERIVNRTKSPKI